ncbi:MAG: hypothetical protein MPJ50_00650 [Pirellulales bacterium]|nr:hypothetical protein [Pirellulales bacterium]
MTKTSMALAAGILMVAATAVNAQQPGSSGQSSISMGELTPTPSMWFYQQQMQSYLNPALAVRRAAEQRAAERDARIAARKWFGYSNSRPMAAHTPFTNWSSPMWAGNGVDRWHWWGVNPTHVVVDRPLDYVIR